MQRRAEATCPMLYRLFPFFFSFFSFALFFRAFLPVVLFLPMPVRDAKVCPSFSLAQVCCYFFSRSRKPLPYSLHGNPPLTGKRGRRLSEAWSSFPPQFPARRTVSLVNTKGAKQHRVAPLSRRFHALTPSPLLPSPCVAFAAPPSRHMVTVAL